jgi:hypothetical protein
MLLLSIYGCKKTKPGLCGSRPAERELDYSVVSWGLDDGKSCLQNSSDPKSF